MVNISIIIMMIEYCFFIVYKINRVRNKLDMSAMVYNGTMYRCIDDK